MSILITIGSLFESKDTATVGRSSGELYGKSKIGGNGVSKGSR